MMATKTVKVCDGCGTDEREPTVALAEAAKNPRQGEMINQWYGADLCLSCRLLVGRVMKKAEKELDQWEKDGKRAYEASRASLLSSQELYELHMKEVYEQMKRDAFS